MLLLTDDYLAPGLQTMLLARLTQVNAGRLASERLATLTSENPARIFGLYPQKGAIQLGSDAHLVFVDMQRQHILRAAGFFSKSRDASRLYDGMAVRGMPVITLVRGTVVYDQGQVVVDPGYGRFVRPIRKSRFLETVSSSAVRGGA